MLKFATLRSRVVPLMAANIDTDVIVRIERLAQLPRDQLGPWAFEALRYLPDGRLNSDCALNDAAFRDARILVAGDNFGCGSSREGAVWAILQAGIRCVIAPRFGNIFYSNCFQNGLLPICLPADTVAALGKRALDGRLELEVDLQAGQIRDGDGSVIGFAIEPLRRRMLLEGLDEIGLTLRRLPEIEDFQRRDRDARPWIHDLAAPLNPPPPPAARPHPRPASPAPAPSPPS
ncbi:MAG: 3-isopropylmalate dehydratase small subunit [Burkholderiaceae bacterium]|nr:3-isopropylmalate dehydratase small subunit [Burkholderiaceae bacterium]